jgi:hypothetical protein
MPGLNSSQLPIEDTPRAINEPQVAVPSLNIFLGSTPAFSALEVMRQLIYLPESDRRRVALLYLDIDAPPSEVSQFRQEHPGALMEFDLRIGVAHGVLYADPLHPLAAQHTYIPTKIPESFDNGAGGIRNNGHVAACTDRAKIVQLLDEALSALGALPAERGARPATEIQINIVAFLGGGTGSGILPDIAVMCRHRVLQLNLKHRLNLFCLLPEHVREATTNDVSWRRSNATATLLELVAVSLAKGEPTADGRAPYTKYLGNAPYVIRGTTIANEIYLFGQTSMNSAENAARLIGIDLYSRITNASGVGFLERSKAVDRRTLGNFDSRGLPTMFATTCPLEVAFPAVETATAFAQMTAARVVPLLAGERPETAYQLNSAELDQVAQWDRALEQPPQQEFTDKQLRTAGRDKLDMLEARLKKQVESVAEKVQEETHALEAKEIRSMGSFSLEPLGAQIRQLQSRRRVYQAALQRVQDQNIPRKGSPDRLLQRKMLKTWAIFGRKDNAVAAVTDDFNRVLKRNIKAIVLTERKELLQRLLSHADGELQKLTRHHGKVNDDDMTRRLVAAAKASPAWRGELDHPHVHRRHLFDLPGVKGMEVVDGESAPVKRLYDLLTPETAIATHADDFPRWLDKMYRDEAGLLALEAADLRERLVQYLRDEVYLPRLYKMNAFELIRDCCLDPGERWETKVESVLYAHLHHIGGLVRKLVEYEGQLWTEGTGNLHTSFFLGMSWRNGTQQRLLERAVQKLGAVGREGISPFMASAIDPHRLQVVYGQHGISLGTLPDFYQEANSSMGEFILHQEAWAGDPPHQHAQIAAMGRPIRPYGASKAPVFSSGEMERLVMHPDGLADKDTPREWRMSLHQRVIRHHQHGAGNKRPDWVDSHAINGSVPNGMPTNGSAPAGLRPDALTPQWPADPGTSYRRS